MDPKVLFLLPALATCPQSPARPTIHWLTPPALPIYHWPEHREWPEGDHPAHGDGSSESPIYLGLGAYTNNSSVSVDSGASGTLASTTPETMWLPNRFPLIVSTRDFDVEPFSPPASPVTMVPSRPDTKKHLRNRSTHRAGRLRNRGPRRS